MGKPRSLKNALETGFIITSIYNKGAKRIRLTLERRFLKRDSFNILNIWIDRDYFKRNYPSTYDRF